MMELKFGDNLRQLREKNGYTRKELAQRISYSEKSIEKWELNSVLPPMKMVCELAELFNVTVDCLLYKNSTEIEYLLGIDGGGTKTEFLLTDRNRNAVRRIVLGGSNPVDVGMDNCQKILEEGISQICKGINLRAVSAFVGLAGGRTSENQERVRDYLSGYSFGKIDNGSDIDNAMEAALADKDGMVVVMGTGIVGFAQKNGTRSRIGGWGYLIDKGGSGFNFGSDALGCALRYLDGRGGSALIDQLIQQQLGKPIPLAISDLYQNGKAHIASLAHVVFTAYENGDSYAREIIARNMKEVAVLIDAGTKITGNRKVAICGGLCHYGAVLQTFLEEELGQGWEIEFITDPIVEGAISLAYKNIVQAKE